MNGRGGRLAILKRRGVTTSQVEARGNVRMPFEELNHASLPRPTYA